MSVTLHSMGFYGRTPSIVFDDHLANTIQERLVRIEERIHSAKYREILKENLFHTV